jgi:hypothetical protein
MQSLLHAQRLSAFHKVFYLTIFTTYVYLCNSMCLTAHLHALSPTSGFTLCRYGPDSDSVVIGSSAAQMKIVKNASDKSRALCSLLVTIVMPSRALAVDLCSSHHLMLPLFLKEITTTHNTQHSIAYRIIAYHSWKADCHHGGERGSVDSRSYSD